MRVGDLETALDWAASEGWNPGLDDAAAFLGADPDGFFLSEDDGTPVAAISVVNHSAAFAFLGLYICRPSHRGRGIGHALWRHALAHAGDRTIGLDGVPDQQENYVKSGFAHTGATTRFSGPLTGRASAKVRSVGKADIAELVSLEGWASGWNKPDYMAGWFEKTENRRSFVLEADGQVQGMVTVRRCRSGSKIGPLIATDEATSRILIEHAAATFDGEVSLDVPASSAPLEKLCWEFGLPPGFHTARMYRGAVRSPAATWYAVATLELG